MTRPPLSTLVLLMLAAGCGSASVSPSSGSDIEADTITDAPSTVEEVPPAQELTDVLPLCINEFGRVQTLKAVIAEKELANYIVSS